MGLYNPETKKGWKKKKKFQWRDKATGRFMSYESMTYINFQKYLQQRYKRLTYSSQNHLKRD